MDFEPQKRICWNKLFVKTEKGEGVSFFAKICSPANEIVSREQNTNNLPMVYPRKQRIETNIQN